MEANMDEIKRKGFLRFAVPPCGPSSCRAARRRISALVREGRGGGFTHRAVRRSALRDPPTRALPLRAQLLFTSPEQRTR